MPGEPGSLYRAWRKKKWLLVVPYGPRGQDQAATTSRQCEQTPVQGGLGKVSSGYPLG